MIVLLLLASIVVFCCDGFESLSGLFDSFAALACITVTLCAMSLCYDGRPLCALLLVSALLAAAVLISRRRTR